MSKKKPRSLQDILRDRQQEEFVGREEQLAFFRANLSYDVEDPRRRFVINVSGQGGVGKTWLLRRFQKIAEEAGTILACTSETEDDVPRVLGHLAQQIEAQGHELDSFTERYKVYRQRKEEIEADPESPQGFPAFVGRTLAKGGLHLARRAPGAGIVAEFVDEEAITNLGGLFASYVARKIKNKDEVRLVLEPVETLTPLFLADLDEVVRHALVVLFFDTYEHTDAFLDAWLRDLLQGRYGEVPADILLVIAGRDELDRNYWSPYEGLLARFPLEPFTEAEARDYLSRKGVTNERIIKVILSLSGQLPLLVATLAVERPDNPDEVGDPSGEAVARFLSWVEDPAQRQIAVDAAVPRLLNRDVLAILTSDERAASLFDWLMEMPFVEKRRDGWVYHDVVRPQMLRYKRQIVPRGWNAAHKQLAAYYQGQLGDLELDERTGLKGATWKQYALEALYHNLCQAPFQQMPVALNGLLAVARTQSAFAQDWAETIYQAGDDSEIDELKRLGARLLDAMQARDKEGYSASVETLTAILAYPGIENRWQAVAFGLRGEAYWRIGRYEQALADFNQALELDCSLAWVIARRGATHRALYNFSQSLTDFNHALEVDPDLTWAVSGRGLTYREMGHYEEAIEDLNHAIEASALDSTLAWTIAQRGLTYRFMKRYEEALTDFDRALDLDADQIMALVFRGITYRDMRCYQEGIDDFQTALDLGADKGWVYANRGVAYRLMERYEEALLDFNRAVELRPDLPWVQASRGTLHRAMHRYQEALADLSMAIEKAPHLAWAIAGRGATYRLLGRYDEALVDFDRAIEIDPDLAWAIGRRGLTYRQTGNYPKALADFARAIELSPDEHWHYYDRALTHHILNHSKEAGTDLAVAIQQAQIEHERRPEDWRNTLRLALYYLSNGEAEKAENIYREAIASNVSSHLIQAAIGDLDEFLAIFSDHPQGSAIQNLLQQYLQEVGHESL